MVSIRAFLFSPLLQWGCIDQTQDVQQSLNLQGSFLSGDSNFQSHKNNRYPRSKRCSSCSQWIFQCHPNNIMRQLRAGFYWSKRARLKWLIMDCSVRQTDQSFSFLSVHEPFASHSPFWKISDRSYGNCHSHTWPETPDKLGGNG